MNASFVQTKKGGQGIKGKKEEKETSIQ